MLANPCNRINSCRERTYLLCDLKITSSRCVRYSNSARSNLPIHVILCIYVFTKLNAFLNKAYLHKNHEPLLYIGCAAIE